MNANEISFGAYLTQLREAHDCTLRELAKKLDISAPYLSDVEKGRKAPLTIDKLRKIEVLFGLSEAEKTTMYDLAGAARNTIAPDIPDYIIDREYVSAALRTARDLDAGEEEWKRFVEELRKGKGNT